jgi:hypothetical protein
MTGADKSHPKSWGYVAVLRRSVLNKAGQALEDTARSKQIKTLADKTCVLVWRRRSLALGSASLSPRVFCSSRTQPTPIVPSLLGLTFFIALATFQFALPLEAAASQSA